VSGGERNVPNLARRCGVAGAIALMMACGGDGGPPTNPGPVQPPPAANQPPTIDSIATGAQRAEVDEAVTVTATVRDAETPVDQLIFEWSADTGSFSGQGASVTWRASADAATPANVVIRLTVREVYGTAPAGGSRPEHRVTGNSNPISLHNSRREIEELSMRFLRDFATSSVSPDACVRDFAETCSGKLDELRDIRDNRFHYDIVSSSLRFRNVGVSSNRMSGNSSVDCSFVSRYKACPPNNPGCTIGSLESVAGTCLLTAIYDQNRWWLCESNFQANNGVMFTKIPLGAPR
jgi:hypothetical protein